MRRQVEIYIFFLLFNSFFVVIIFLECGICFSSWFRRRSWRIGVYIWILYSFFFFGKGWSRDHSLVFKYFLVELYYLLPLLSPILLTNNDSVFLRDFGGYHEGVGLYIWILYSFFFFGKRISRENLGVGWFSDTSLKYVFILMFLNTFKWNYII
jgi:hypothetical protein